VWLWEGKVLANNSSAFVEAEPGGASKLSFVRVKNLGPTAILIPRLKAQNTTMKILAELRK